jgi:hypothetical protein
MTRRTLLGNALLLVASFGVSLAFLTPGGIPPRGAARQLLQAAWNGTARQAPAGSSSTPAVGLSFSASGSSDANQDQLPASAELPTDFDAPRRDATMATETEERIRALQILAEAPADKALDVLVGAVTNGADAGERAMAITSLRSQLTRGDGSGDARVRNALLAASTDQDPVVVMLSQSLLEDLDRPR